MSAPHVPQGVSRGRQRRTRTSDPCAGAARAARPGHRGRAHLDRAGLGGRGRSRRCPAGIDFADAGRGQAAGQASARAALRQDGLDCSPVVIDQHQPVRDHPPGEPAAVTATVRCTVSLADLALPGLPGSRAAAGRHSPARSISTGHAEHAMRLSPRCHTRSGTLRQRAAQLPRRLACQDRERGGLSLMLVDFVRGARRARRHSGRRRAPSSTQTRTRLRWRRRRPGPAPRPSTSPAAYSSGSFVVSQQQALAAARSYLIGPVTSRYSVAADGDPRDQGQRDHHRADQVPCR